MTHLSKWCADSRSDAESALRQIWNDQEDIESCVRGFSSRFPTSVVSGIGTRTRLISFLAMAIDPHQYAMYGRDLYRKAYDLVGQSHPDDDADEATVYSHALKFLDTLLEEARKHGLELQDRLFAQSLIWSVLNAGHDRTDVVPKVDYHAFLKFRDGVRPVGDPS